MILKNKAFNRTAKFILIPLICLALLFPAYASQPSDSVVGIIDGILEFKQTQTESASLQEFINGDITQNAGSTSEWYVISLSQYSKALDFSPYTNALNNYVTGKNISGAVTRQKYALALVSAGIKDSEFITATANDTIGKQGIMSLIFGLHLLNNGVSSDALSKEEVIDKIISAELSDGGWALSGSNSTVDVTAMAIQALAPYYDTLTEVKTAVDNALEFLSSAQLDDGGYSTFGENNPESTSQVIIALTSLGISPNADTRFIKQENTLIDNLLSYKLDDGSFCHSKGGEYNHSATFQALSAFVSVWRLNEGKSSYYLFDKKEADASTDTAVTDSDTVSEAPQDSEKSDTVNYKTPVIIAIISVSLIFCLLLWILKKRNLKNYVFVLIIAAAAISFVIFTDFSSPEEYYSEVTLSGEPIGTVSLTIRCTDILGMSDMEYIPKDGFILKEEKFEITEGCTVYDLLIMAAKKHGIHVESSGVVAGSSKMAYIAGINHIYEFDFGDLSGWQYFVNGVSPSVSCGSLELLAGDSVEWVYSLDISNFVK